MSKRRSSSEHNAPVWAIAGVAVASIVAVVLAFAALRPSTPPVSASGYNSGSGDYSQYFDREAVTRVAVVGDSYTGGSQMGGTGAASWSRQFVSDMPNWGTAVFAIGGAGFSKPSPDGRRFIDRLDEIVAENPDIVIVAGGHNDNNLPPEQVETDAAELFGALRAQLPEARIIAVAPFEQRTPTEPYLLTRDAIFRAATAAGVTDFIDPLAEGWFNDDRGVDGANSLIGSDGVHPTDEGHQLMAEKMREALDRLGITI